MWQQTGLASIYHIIYAFIVYYSRVTMTGLRYQAREHVGVSSPDQRWPHSLIPRLRIWC